MYRDTLLDEMVTEMRHGGDRRWQDSRGFQREVGREVAAGAVVRRGWQWLRVDRKGV